MMKRLIMIILTLGLLTLLPLEVWASDWSIKLDNFYWEREDVGDQTLWSSNTGPVLNANELNFKNDSKVERILEWNFSFNLNPTNFSANYLEKFHLRLRELTGSRLN